MKHFALRRIVIKIDGENFASFEKVEINPKHRHHKATHYIKNTPCGLAITKKTKTESNMRDVSCPDCLRTHVSKLSKQLHYFEGLLEEAKKI